MHSNALADVSSALVITAWASAVLFDAVYTVLAPWWKTWMGRNLFAFDASIAAVLTPAVLALWFHYSPRSPWYAWLQIGLFAVVPALSLQRTVMLVVVQARGRSQPQQPGNPGGGRRH